MILRLRWPALLGRFSPRRLLLMAAGVTLAWVSFLYLVLPPDNGFILMLRWWAYSISSAAPSVRNGDEWFFKHSEFPVDLDHDAIFILKTGYGTQDRIAAQLEALDLKLRGKYEETVLVVGDFEKHIEKDGQNFEIKDMVKVSMEHEALRELQDAERLKHYRDMSQNIATAKEPALDVGKKYGWELDALKFVPALEHAWNSMPRRKWYLVLDDDTFVVKPSLQLLLGHLDPAKPNYLGNAVGDFKGRFAHGGSIIAISEAAMAKLFDHNPDAVRAAYVDSLTEVWGDRLVSYTFMKAGVYLDERYARFFNGEPPAVTRIRPDRFCAPLVSFHSLTKPEKMAEVGKKFREIAAPVFWSHLWKIYNREPLEKFDEVPVRPGIDYVGRPEDHGTTRKSVLSAEECRTYCKSSSSCLAWTWNERARSCVYGPWFVIGETSDDKNNDAGLYSGIVAHRVSGLQRDCEDKWVKKGFMRAF